MMTKKQLAEFMWAHIKKADKENYYCDSDEDRKDCTIELYEFDLSKFAAAILRKVKRADAAS